MANEKDPILAAGMGEADPPEPGSNDGTKEKRDWLKRDDFRNGLSLVLWLVALSLGIIYLGYVSNISLEALLTFTFGGLAAVSIISVTIVRLDTKDRGFVAGLKAKPEIGKLNDEIESLNNQVNNDELGQEFIDQYNDKEQLLNDKRFTGFKVRRLKFKVRRIRIRGTAYWFKFLNPIREHRIKRLEAKIKLLTDNILTRPFWHVRKKYIPLDYKDIVNLSAVDSDTASTGKKAHKSNPKTDGTFKSIFMALLKGFALGGAGTIPFLINTPVKVIVAFYISLLVTMLLTAVLEFRGTKKKTQTTYFEARKRVKKRLNEMLSFIKDKEAELNAAKIAAEKEAEAARIKAEEDKRKQEEHEERMRNDEAYRREQEELAASRAHELELERIKVAGVTPGEYKAPEKVVSEPVKTNNIAARCIACQEWKKSCTGTADKNVADDCKRFNEVNPIEEAK